jgi:protein O-mannosyl-transferase
MAKRPGKRRKKPAVEAAPAARTHNRKAFPWTFALQALAIVAAGFWIYGPELHAEWLWDDDTLVTANPNLRSFEGLGKIWFAPPATDYWPLTWTLLWLEWQLWGAEPVGYHLSTLALHLSSGFIVWRLFTRLGLQQGWLGGLLFVIHPLAVESVAWMSEVKNTLSLPFYLLALDAWMDHEEGSSSGYWRSILYYVAAMLCKTSTVMLPIVLLLYCWWKRGRIARREIRLMIPFCLIAVILGLLTIHFQDQKPNSDEFELGGPFTRLVGGATALFFYLGKFVLPIGLLPIYPRWTSDAPSTFVVLTSVLFFLLFLGLATQRKDWCRAVLFGLGFFLLNLLPVLGFLKMSYLQIASVADHFVYLPMIGLIGLAVAGWDAIRSRVPASARLPLMAVLAALGLSLAWASRAYAGKFMNPQTLWTYTLLHNPLAWPAYGNLGDILLKAGHPEEAAGQFRQLLLINSRNADGHNNLGNALLQMGRISEAMEQYEAALRIFPNNARAHNNLGLALVQSGQLPAAIEQFQAALQIEPDYSHARTNLNAALRRLQQSRPP